MEAMLFDKKKLQGKRMDLPSVSIDGEVLLANGKGWKQLQQQIGTIENGRTIHYWSEKDWSVSELVLYIVKQIGPADVWFASWSLGNESIVNYKRGLDLGLLLSVNAVCSTRLKHNHADMYQAAVRSFTRVALDEIHAKVTVLENADWCISIFGSANQTANPRKERCAIVPDKRVGQMDRDMIENILIEYERRTK